VRWKKLSNENPFFVYSKEVKGEKINTNKITLHTDKKNLLKVISSLLSIGSVKSKNLDEISLKENCVLWIDSIFKDYPKINEEFMMFLIQDFTDSMFTRMREEEKYAIGIVTGDLIILCHSLFGEKTITPTWKVIERMLDKDNVIRYVCFKKEGNKIKVIFYEETKSVFFVQWLGIPEKEALSYFGGKNKFVAELHDTWLSLEFTDEDFEKQILQDKIFTIKENTIVLPSPVNEFHLIQIWRGKRPYKNYEDFLQDFLAQRYELAYYQEEYKKLINSLTPLTKKLIDDEDELRDVSGKTLVKKRNPNFNILFCNGTIDIRPAFLEKILTKLLNGEQIRIFHAGMNLISNPLRINKLEIYNPLITNLSKPMIEYHNEMFGRIPSAFANIFLHITLHLLYLENSDKPISYFLKRLRDKLLNKLTVDSKLPINENNVIELKSRDFLSDKNEELLEKMVNDITKKLEENPFKIYIIGYDEKIKQFEPFPSSRFNDNRINYIKTELKRRLKRELELFKLTVENSSSCILILVVRKNDGRI
jgi:hypothetical protein